MFWRGNDVDCLALLQHSGRAISGEAEFAVASIKPSETAENGYARWFRADESPVDQNGLPMNCSTSKLCQTHCFLMLEALLGDPTVVSLELRTRHEITLANASEGSRQNKGLTRHRQGFTLRRARATLP